MKTNAIKGIIIPVLMTGLCSIILLSSTAVAQNKPGKNVTMVTVQHRGNANPGMMISGLTDEQKTKLKDLRLEHMKAVRLLKAQGQELAAHLKTLNLAEKPDNKAIFKTIDEMMATRGEVMKRMISFRQAVKAILTPAQIKELELRHMNGRFGMNGRGGRFQQGNRNFGRGPMMQRGGMNRQAMMMHNGPMQQRMMMFRNAQNGQPMQPGQMQKRFQIMRDNLKIKADSTKIAK